MIQPFADLSICRCLGTCPEEPYYPVNPRPGEFPSPPVRGAQTASLRNQVTAPTAGGAVWTNVPGTPSFPTTVAPAPATMSPEEVQRSAGRQVPSWDVPIKPHPSVSPVPEVQGGLTGARTLPEITVKPPPEAQAETTKPTETAAETGKPKSAPSKTKPKAGMTQTQRRALTRRAAPPPPPVPKLGPYGGGESSTGYVQPGEPGYQRAYQYCYGRNP